MVFGLLFHIFTLILPSLAYATTISCNFDLWMSKGDVDTFALVIIFLNESWIPMYVTMGLFQVHETSGQSMVIQLESLLSKFGSMHCDCIVKNESSNLIAMASTLRPIINCEPLKIIKVYEGMCFG
jgi:hypothetical protein